jgi:hypothetical protein
MLLALNLSGISDRFPIIPEIKGLKESGYINSDEAL